MCFILENDIFIYSDWSVCWPYIVCSGRANVTESQDDVLAVGAVYTGRCQFDCWLQSTISYQFILMMIFLLASRVAVVAERRSEFTCQ
ncbi:hypothetical protein TorRG33x02_002950 [Trema orientale]|uniref:Uncharacterized protein n=1 Tax=Trema orientale TaxID=63057 RepID=A0A2P5G1V3_TREOI|nr:hypothetical protein TorRG33x02_002950 [Trema orientale]